MRYIDADWLIEQLQPAKNAEWNKNDHSKSLSEMIEDFCTELKNAPSADVVPRAIVNLIFEDIFLCSEYENGKLVIDHDKIVGIKNRFQRRLNL